MLATVSHSQISPGDLSQAHAKLEGMSKCTLCHDLGEKVSNKKCLECHDEIQVSLTKKSGYHASSTVVKKDCFECHSEHHGRKFDMVRFDQANFKHNITGYTLEGKHETVDCRKCHKPDNISDKDLKKRKKTFLGLDEKCLSCHDDIHQKTLSNDCMQCHTMKAFKPASQFDHDEAEYTLKGKHLEVDCIECHAVTTKNGQEFQQFTDLEFSDCKSCHEDPHNSQLIGQCIQCHTETSFSSFTGKGNFNHTETGFILKGKHTTIDCFSCHSKTSNPTTVFQDKVKTKNENNCVACHEDQHEGKYGTDCAKCHKESSFLSLKKMDFFDHNVTAYPLEGKHIEVDCKQCHKKRFSTPINFTACNSCHDDYHTGEFKENNVSPDCIACHSLENGFDYSLYTLEQHQTTTFPLEGAHYATPCYVCHVSEDDKRWTFANLGSTCIDCHKDTHEGYISKKFYPEKDCTTCHSNDNWASVSFDHTRTKWPLTGEHKKVDCRSCHFEDVSNDKFTQTFIGQETDCITCHENPHKKLFAISGVTDCIRCHATDSWFPKKFNHNNTSFPLKGKHEEIACNLCHTVDKEDGTTEIIYKLGKFECIDCHQ